VAIQAEANTCNKNDADIKNATRRTTVDFNKARDEGVAVTSTALYANHLYFAPNR